jgi:drug/metabolite transporter (DMT)-like permease
MLVAGVAWGAYSIAGQGVPDPVAASAGNFARALLLSLVLVPALVAAGRVTAAGVLLAVASGTVASGLGYVAWYAAVRRLETVQAAVVQLAVPVLAGVAGLVVLSEVLTPRLVVAAGVILGGIALATTAGGSRPAAGVTTPPVRGGRSDR